MMARRSGSVDPGLLIYLLKHAGVDFADLDRGLNEDSGLAGVSGVSEDWREVQAAAWQGNKRAELARAMFLHRLVATVGAHTATLGGVDALVFTGGIGENSAEVRGGRGRSRVCWSPSGSADSTYRNRRSRRGGNGLQRAGAGDRRARRPERARRRATAGARSTTRRISMTTASKIEYGFDASISSAVRLEHGAASAAKSRHSGPLSTELLDRMHRYIWLAANYLTVGQIYLQDNPLLREPLVVEHIKPRLLGHWERRPAGVHCLCAPEPAHSRPRSQCDLPGGSWPRWAGARG